MAAASRSACSVRRMPRRGTSSTPCCSRSSCAWRVPARGTDILVNGRPVFLRGTHHSGDFPLTGYPPTDVAYWKKIFAINKGVGHQPRPLPLVHAAGSGIPGGGRGGHLPAAGVGHVEPFRARRAHRHGALRRDRAPDPCLRQPPVVPAAQPQQRAVGPVERGVRELDSPFPRRGPAPSVHERHGPHGTRRAGYRPGRRLPGRAAHRPETAAQQDRLVRARLRGVAGRHPRAGRRARDGPVGRVSGFLHHRQVHRLPAAGELRDLPRLRAPPRRFGA